MKTPDTIPLFIMGVSQIIILLYYTIPQAQQTTLLKKDLHKTGITYYILTRY